MAGSEYTIADMAIWPWYGGLVEGTLYGDAARFLDARRYPHVVRWSETIADRPAVRRGRLVNRNPSGASKGLRERHDAGDFDRI
jgi:GST-like protein